MQSLAAGRGISLPASATAGTKVVARVAGAHALVRKQFGLSIGKFEGIEEPLARIGGWAYLTEAARRYTNGGLDQGAAPAVVTAMMKYNTTEIFRKAINDGMDILGGNAISRGPRNPFACAYTGVPVSITVEGANILTRTLMVFGQGAIRCHPYALKEMQALQTHDVRAFDAAFWPHIGHVVRNAFRAVGLSVSRGWLAGSPVSGAAAPYWRKLQWAQRHVRLPRGPRDGHARRRPEAQGEAHGPLRGHLLVPLPRLGRARALRGRGPAQGGRPVPRSGRMDYSFARIQDAFDGLFANLQVPGATWLFRGPLAAWSRFNRISDEPSDRTGGRVAALMQVPGEQRDRLFGGVFVPTDPDDGRRPLRARDGAGLPGRGRREQGQGRRQGQAAARAPTRPRSSARPSRPGILTADEAALLTRAEDARADCDPGRLVHDRGVLRLGRRARAAGPATAAGDGVGRWRRARRRRLRRPDAGLGRHRRRALSPTARRSRTSRATVDPAHTDQLLPACAIGCEAGRVVPFGTRAPPPFYARCCLVVSSAPDAAALALAASQWRHRSRQAPPQTAACRASTLPSRPRRPPARATSARRACPTAARIRVDGRMDEPAWAEADVADQLRPVRARPRATPRPSGPRRACSSAASALYVAVRCYARDPAAIVRRLRRRDVGPADVIDADDVFVEIGSSGDSRTAFSFGISAAGVQFDAVLSDDRDAGDYSWDAVWDSAVAPFSGPDGSGYTVEIRVPFSQLRYDPTRRRGRGRSSSSATSPRRASAPTGRRSCPTGDGYVSRFGVARRPRRARRAAPRRGRPLRLDAPHARRRRRGRPVLPEQRAAPRRRARRQDRPHGRPHADGHRQPGLRAGRGRPGRAQPVAVREPLRGAPPVLRRVAGPLRLRDHARLRHDGRPADVLLLAPHRRHAVQLRLALRRHVSRHDVPRQPRADHDRGRGQGLGPGRRLDGRPDERVHDARDGALPHDRRHARGAAGRAVRQLRRRSRAAGVARRADARRRVRDERHPRHARATPSAPCCRRQPPSAGSTSRSRPTRGRGRAQRSSQRAPSTASRRRDHRAPARPAALLPASRRGLRRGQPVPAQPLGATAPRPASPRPAAAATGAARSRSARRAPASRPTTSASSSAQTFSQATSTSTTTCPPRARRGSARRASRATPTRASTTAATTSTTATRRSCGPSSRTSGTATLTASARPEQLNDRLTRGGPVVVRAERLVALGLALHQLGAARLGRAHARRRAASSTAATSPSGASGRGRSRPTSPSARRTPSPSRSSRPTSARATRTSISAASPRRRARRRRPALPVLGHAHRVARSQPARRLGLLARPDAAARRRPVRVLGPLPGHPRVGRGPDLRLRPLRRDARLGHARRLRRRRRRDARRQRPRPTRFSIDPGDGGATFTVANNDFTQLSLRGNAVLRWQWRPGSALFFVWQQVRDEVGPFSGYDVLADVPDVFSATVQNVFLLKATYWFGL